MDWNKDKSVMLSRVCIVVFAILLAAADIGAYWLVSWFMGVSRTLGGLRDGYLLLTTVYSCSVFAWILLVNLWKLLANIQRGMPFETSSVNYLRVSSWCCAGVCTICLLSTLYYTPLILVSIASGFMALIVRIIKNVFEQAIAMKTELDYTV
ncbi:MAG TPA: DUF2975 domain-containing protein [Clostridiaceae bacterium]|nr:DUF2975 domain-containing protein [Clostridiaceae bacterium]